MRVISILQNYMVFEMSRFLAGFLYWKKRILLLWKLIFQSEILEKFLLEVNWGVLRKNAIGLAQKRKRVLRKNANIIINIIIHIIKKK